MGKPKKVENSLGETRKNPEETYKTVGKLKKFAITLENLETLET